MQHGFEHIYSTPFNYGCLKMSDGYGWQSGTGIIAISISSIQDNIEFCTFYIYRKLLHENWEYVAFIPTIKFDKYTWHSTRIS